MIKAILFFMLFSLGSFANSEEIILQKKIDIQISNLNLFLTSVESDLRPFAENFHIQLDSGSKVVVPQEISGTQMQPVLKMSVKKCVFIFCQTIDLDVEFLLQKTSGSCDRNYLLSANLSRSSQLLTQLYSSIDTQICVHATDTGGQMQLRSTLIRAPDFQNNLIQKNAYALIKLQGQAIFESLVQVLKLNGASSMTLIED